MNNRTLFFAVIASFCVMTMASHDARGTTPSLCFDVAGSALPNPSCHPTGTTLTATVELGASTTPIAGGQFRIEYDPAALDLVSATTGTDCDPATPFTLEIFRDIDEPNGVAFLAVHVPIGGEPTTAANTLACLTFTVIAECSSVGLCLTSVNPQITRLVDDQGANVPPDFGPCANANCSIPAQAVGPVDLTCPTSVNANFACGAILWPPASADSNCEGSLSVSCSAGHDGGENVQGLIAGGGLFPEGVTNFSCTAEDSCGQSNQCQWSVTVPHEPPPTCDDGLACTVNACDALAGCGYTPDDALCDDANPCTDDACDAFNGCQHFYNTDPCDESCMPPIACADELADGEMAVLNPGGGSPDLTNDAHVDFTNNSGGAASIVATEHSSPLHPPSGGFSLLGTTLNIDVEDSSGADLPDGTFQMTIAVPFDEAALAGADPMTVRIAWFNAAAPPSGQWILAVAGNVQASPGHEPSKLGDVFTVSGTTTPALGDLSDEIGDYGVFWNTNTLRGFAWANVDHASDFAAGVCINRKYADLFPSKGDGIVELGDVLYVLGGYSDQGSYPDSDIAPCFGDGITELSDVLSMLATYAGNPTCPDRCP